MTPRPSLSIGIEEEYQIVDPETRELRSYITEFIDNGKLVMMECELKPELHQAMVELGTPVCSNIAQVKEALIKQRRFICRLAQSKGVEIAAASTHPFSKWMDQPVTPYERYMGVLEEMQLLAQRLLIFGMHVHVGVEDRKFAIDAMNVVRYMLPHILALSTSSPFWMGRKTGMKSYRANIFEDFPRSGISDVYRTPADYDALIKTLVNTGSIPDASKIWWDVRPHHHIPHPRVSNLRYLPPGRRGHCHCGTFSGHCPLAVETAPQKHHLSRLPARIDRRKSLACGTLRFGRQNDRLRQIDRIANPPAHRRTTRPCG